MPAKGTIKPDHVRVNKFFLLVNGMPPLTVVAMDGIEEEIEKVTLPDRTSATGGNSGPLEFSISIPAHHHLERTAMSAWLLEGKDPVSPTYKKVGTLIMESGTGANVVSRTLNGLWCAGEGTPELEMANEGEMAVMKYPMSADEMLPI